MKKSLLALAVLGAFAGAASAQSSVTLFGVIDVNVGEVKNENGVTGVSTTIKREGTNGINSSRLGFRGVEDLGSGLKAGFWLEAGVTPDTDDSSGTNGLGTVFFNRRSTVSLMGNFGEIRLGRDYTPSFWNLTAFDPCGTNGIGSFCNLFTTSAGGDLGRKQLGSTMITTVRDNNTVGYFLPSNLGGIYGQAMIAAGEAVSGQKYQGGRIGYAAGPIDAAVAIGRTTVDPSSTGDDKFTWWNIGGSYDFGVAKLMGVYSDEKWDPARQKSYLLGVVVPMGQGEIHASYDHAKQSGVGATEPTSKQYALGYVYNLSKRTALYGTYSRLTNSDGANNTINSGGSGSALNGKSQGVEAGLRHSF